MRIIGVRIRFVLQSIYSLKASITERVKTQFKVCREKVCLGQSWKAEARPVERGDEREGKFSRAPLRLVSPPSLKNTEKGVPDGFFLTSNIHKIHFWPGLCPDPARGAHDAPHTLVGC